MSEEWEEVFDRLRLLGSKGNKIWRVVSLMRLNRCFIVWRFERGASFEHSERGYSRDELLQQSFSKGSRIF